MAIETDSIVIFHFTMVLDTEDKIKVLAFWQRHVSTLSLMRILSVIPGEELVLEKPVCLIIITYPCKPHLLNKTVLKWLALSTYRLINSPLASTVRLMTCMLAKVVSCGKRPA